MGGLGYGRSRLQESRLWGSRLRESRLWESRLCPSTAFSGGPFLPFLVPLELFLGVVVRLNSFWSLLV